VFVWSTVGAGKAHLVRLPASSLRNQPPRSTAEAVPLWISIQSGESPSSSSIVLSLDAMNSLIRTCAAREAESTAAASSAMPDVSQIFHGLLNAISFLQKR